MILYRDYPEEIIKSPQHDLSPSEKFRAWFASRYLASQVKKESPTIVQVTPLLRRTLELEGVDGSVMGEVGRKLAQRAISFHIVDHILDHRDTGERVGYGEDLRIHLYPYPEEARARLEEVLARADQIQPTSQE